MKQPERYVEPRLTQYLFDRASRTLTPLSGTFELSPVCNLACKMCYVRKTPAEVAASPRPPVGLIQWLSIAEQARDAGMLYLLLTGGEPFLWQDFWPLYERLSTMGFLISINSNGTLLDEARVARLAEHPPTRINITLYGAGNETYEALCGRSGMFDPRGPRHHPAAAGRHPRQAQLLPHAAQRGRSGAHRKLCRRTGPHP